MRGEDVDLKGQRIMHRRYQHSSIPTEIMRSVVGISEAGSITKAAKLLGLSQPAISSQIKRIEHAVGGSIFQKSANGSSTTELGKLVLIQARKILEANDQLLLLRGASPEDQTIRLGLTNFYSQRAMEGMSKAAMSNVCIYSDNSAEIAKSMLDGYVDVGVFLSISDMPGDAAIDVIAQRDDELAWVRSRDFTLSPGAPIPLLTWPGQIVHNVMIQALERKGMIYRIAFSSPDYHARIEAAKAGIGLTLLPTALIPASLLAANEYYLPKLAIPKLVLCAREGIRKKHSILIEELHVKFFSI
ncbi:LysR family transcriptional regulator [Tardiphaga sp. 1201_B9_N1_1]|uniref:LysR family transcriptional regulator n=1 Tax=Tardiphaga TaxID=1395974 RepID=UPI0011C49AB3|nr:LysR family transcriptional regulator [Tardiphaga robiniae]MDR6658544.1 DNA-binding transcriptional LysR family regulator [Tardiphaga robiniae]